MAKREKIDFDKLEEVSGRPKHYSEEALLEIIASPSALTEKSDAEQMEIIAAISQQLEESPDFKKKALRTFEKSLWKPKR